MRKSLKKLISVLTIICILALSVTSGLFVYADTVPQTVVFDGVDTWARFDYTKGWSKITAGHYRFEMDCVVFSGEPIISVGEDTTGATLSVQEAYSAYYDDKNYKYIITFNITTDWSGNLGVRIGNYDTSGNFMCANPVLYKLDDSGNPQGDSLINTFADSFYSSSRTADRWNRRSTGYVCLPYSRDYFDMSTSYENRIVMIAEMLVGIRARLGHPNEDINNDGAFDVRDLIKTKQLQLKDISGSSEGEMISLINSSGYDASKEFTGGASAQAKALKDSILSSENTEDIYEITGKKYYIKKTDPISAVPSNLNAGDAVLFERGGVWRVNRTTLVVPQGVIFGAYGTGDKPAFYGSAKNYAKSATWTSAGTNLWRTSLSGGNAGIMVFNEKYALGVKKWTKDEVTADYDFYSDDSKSILYFYYSGNPKTDFSSIEIGQRNNIIDVKSGAIADNLCVKYTGAHGIIIPSTTENAKVTNCVVGMLGGSQQLKETRYGNGIEMQLGVKNVEVSGNYVYQCYDAGITFQSWDSANRATYYDGLDISNNLVEFCYYGLEFFTTVPEQGGSYSELHNISVKNNIFRFSGYVWSYEQRPDHWMNAHIRSSQRGWFEETENFRIEKNIFDCSRASMIFWWWRDRAGELGHPADHPGLFVGGNSFYQAKTDDRRCIIFRDEDPVYASNITGLKNAVAVFDSTPAKITWIAKL